MENGVFSDFSVNKYRTLFASGAVFVYTGWLGGLYDSQATNRSAPAGGEFSH